MGAKVITVDFKARRRLVPPPPALARSVEDFGQWACKAEPKRTALWVKVEGCPKADLSTAKHLRRACADSLTFSFQCAFNDWRANNFKPADVVEIFHTITVDAVKLMAHLNVDWWLEHGMHEHHGVNVVCGAHALFMFRRDAARGAL